MSDAEMTGRQMQGGPTREELMKEGSRTEGLLREGGERVMLTTQQEDRPVGSLRRCGLLGIARGGVGAWLLKLSGFPSRPSLGWRSPRGCRVHWCATVRWGVRPQR